MKERGHGDFVTTLLHLVHLWQARDPKCKEKWFWYSIALGVYYAIWQFIGAFFGGLFAYWALGSTGRLVLATPSYSLAPWFGDKQAIGLATGASMLYAITVLYASRWSVSGYNMTSSKSEFFYALTRGAASAIQQLIVVVGLGSVENFYATLVFAIYTDGPLLNGTSNQWWAYILGVLFGAIIGIIVFTVIFYLAEYGEETKTDSNYRSVIPSFRNGVEDGQTPVPFLTNYAGTKGTNSLGLSKPKAKKASSLNV